MGSFIPTTTDNEICNNLNNRFSQLPVDPKNSGGIKMIDSVRVQDGKEGGLLFSRKLNLARLAYRLGGYPADPSARLRWYFFLRRMLPHATKVAISAVLETVMGDSSIKQVIFQTIPDGTITTEFELDPNNSHAPTFQNLPSTANPAVNVKTCVVLLRCFYDDALPNPINEPDPPNPQNPEVGPPIIP